MLFYQWKKKLLGSAAQVFEEKPKKSDAQQERLERESPRMKAVVAEIRAENLELRELGWHNSLEQVCFQIP